MLEGRERDSGLEVNIWFKHMKIKGWEEETVKTKEKKTSATRIIISSDFNNSIPERVYDLRRETC